LGLERELREEREEINEDRVSVGDMSVVVSGFSSGYWAVGFKRERKRREKGRGMKTD